MTPVCLCMERSLLNHSRNDYELQLGLEIAPSRGVKNLKQQSDRNHMSARTVDEVGEQIGCSSAQMVGLSAFPPVAQQWQFPPAEQMRQARRQLNTSVLDRHWNWVHGELPSILFLPV